MGDDQPYKTLAAVPWGRMGWGDAVRIHWRPEPYREKIVVTGSGRPTDPLRICGVAGPNGQPPVIDGENATTSASAAFAHVVHERRGLVTVSGSPSDGSGQRPHDVLIEGLELRNAGAPFKFIDSKGANQAYAENAACFFVERAERLTLRGNEVHHCGNGIFVASGDQEAALSRDIVIDANHIHHNGSVGQGRERHHDAYTEAIGIVYQFNRFGPVREGSLGIQLKDRSAGTVVRYNWFEGGQRVIDLVEPEDSYAFATKAPGFHETYVYGNVIVVGSEASSRMVHFGGDNGNTADYRKGTLFFYANTIVVDTRASEQWSISLLKLETNDETADVRNNVIHASGDTHLAWLFEEGTLDLGVNWVNRPVAPARDKLAGTLKHVLGSDKTIVGGASPFVDAARGDYCLLPSSTARRTGGPLASAVPRELLPTLQYQKHQRHRPRPSLAVSAGDALGALVCD